MYRSNVSNIIQLFFIVIFIFASMVSCASINPKPALPENDFILRSCMSSVEFNRRNIDIPESKFSLTSKQSPSRIMDSTIIPLSSSTHRFNSIELKAREKMRKNMIRDRPARKSIPDTPLKTLNLKRKGRDDAPQTFVKIDLLPEVGSSVSNTKQNEKETSIILIQSA